MSVDPNKLAVGQIIVDDATHEVVDYAFPPEPPVRTVIVDGHGLLHQRVTFYWWDTVSMSRTTWATVGKKVSRWRDDLTWIDIVARGPVTILWIPSAELIKKETP